jgi:hypothetical protein
MEAYTFAINIVADGTPNPQTIFAREIETFVANHTDATVQSCSMTTAMYTTEIAARVGAGINGMLFGVIFYTVT